MYSMFKDLFVTVYSSFLPGILFAFMILSISPEIKKQGIKNYIKNFCFRLKTEKIIRHKFYFFFYIYIVFYRTLLSRSNNYNPFSNILGGWKITVSVYNVVNYEVIGNILIFIPITLLFLTAYGSSYNTLKIIKNSLLLTLCTTAFIEICQIIFIKGTFQISDLVYNTLGGGLGAFIYLMIKAIVKKKKKKKRLKK